MVGVIMETPVESEWVDDVIYAGQHIVQAECGIKVTDCGRIATNKKSPDRVGHDPGKLVEGVSTRGLTQIV
jgi:hypothetical protein